MDSPSQSESKRKKVRTSTSVKNKSESKKSRKRSSTSHISLKKKKERKKELSESDSSHIKKLCNKSPIKATDDIDFDTLGREISCENYQIISLLGVGSQGRVYLVRLTSTDQYFALKVFRKDRVLPNEKTTRSIITEHRFLATTDHPFVTKLFHSFHSYERLFMVMEFCPGGELFTTIKKQPNGHLTEYQVLFYASEVILVLEFIHSKGYIYRDLKPENILLHADGHIRMADFGLSKQAESGPNNTIENISTKTWNPFSKKKTDMELQQGEVLRTNSLVGSVHYLAPEVISGESYDVMADWWAFGVLLYDMYYGYPPFKGRTNKQIITRISKCEYTFPTGKTISPNLKSLIKGLLKIDPNKRICKKHGAADIKRHPFFEDTHWGLLRNRTPPIIPNVKSPCDTTHFEIYADDEDSVDFNFFSELPEDPYAITQEDQIKFSDFHFTRKDYGELLFERKNKIKQSKKQSKKQKKKVTKDANSTDESKYAVSVVVRSKSKSPSKRKKTLSGEDKSSSTTTPRVTSSKKAKSKPIRKQSATHKEDDEIR